VITIPSPCVIVPSASPASRPVYRIDGFVALDEVE
jgi:hypothetical protein